MHPHVLAFLLLLLLHQNPQESLLAYHLPYTLIAGGVWIVFLMIWIALGIPMGPGYAPTL